MKRSGIAVRWSDWLAVFNPFSLSVERFSEGIHLHLDLQEPRAQSNFPSSHQSAGKTYNPYIVA